VEQRFGPLNPSEVVSRTLKSIFFDLQNEPNGSGVLIRENEEDVGTGKYGQIINSELKAGGIIHLTLEIYHDTLVSSERGTFVNLTLLDASVGGSQNRSLISLPDNDHFMAKIEVQSRDSQGSLLGNIFFQIRCKKSS